MKRLLFCIFVLFQTLSLQGQNMVLNPGFEQISQCPSSAGGITTGWAPHWSSLTMGSPDLFHVCGTVNYCTVPDNAVAVYQQPHSGQGYAGLICANSYYIPSNGNREYMRGELTPLTPGVQYKVTIHVNLSNKSMYAINGFGVFFFQNGLPISTSGNFAYPIPTQIDYTTYPPVIDTQGWTVLVDTFVADSAYNQIAVGNFSMTYTVVPVPYLYSPFVYYLFDDIMVEEITIPLTATINGINVLCYTGNSGSATVLPSGGLPPYTYLWSNGQTTQTATNLIAGTYTCTITDAANNTVTQTITITQPPALSATVLSITNVLCAGDTTGAMAVSVAGGTPPYTYQWLPGGTGTSISGVTAGTYTFTVTDANNCTATVSATITQPTALFVSGSLTNVSCYGMSNGTITTIVTGGIAPYTYLWSNGQTSPAVTGLAAGVYYVTVTDNNGCTYGVVGNVTQPPVLNLVTSVVNPTSCTQNTGTATVAASGGTPPYTYSWSPSGGTSNNATNLAAGAYVITVTDSKGCTDTVHIIINTSTPPTVSISSVVNVNCYGQSTGSATASASNGVAPYTYLWSNGQTTATATGLAAGTYTVTATGANGCANSATVTITQPPILNVNISSFTNVNCNGQGNGSAIVLASGGTPGYTYQWLPSGGTGSSATGLSAGTYTVSVTDIKGCTGTATVTISQPQALNATISSANATCSQNNGWATVTPTGGTTPYTYLWSNGQTASTINNLAAGTYSVTVTDAHGCTKVATVTISQSTALTINIAATNVSCNGQDNGTATALAQTGTAPYIYQWSNGQSTQTATNLAPGTYTVTVTDIVHCSGTATITITEPTVLNSNINTSTNVLCHGDNSGEATVSVTGGTTPYTYQWSNNTTSATVANLIAGTYTVTVTDSNGCTITSTVTITEPTELTLTTTAMNNSCKNETQGSATVAASGGIPPYSYQWNNGQTGTTATNLAAGVYNITVTDNNNCSKTIQIAVGEYPLPAVDAGDDQLFCQGKEAVTLRGNGADTYQWLPTTNLSCAICQVTEATPEISTVYTLTGIDANGCKATDEVIVSVVTKQPTSAGADIHICGSKSVILEASGGFQYEWSPVDGMENNQTSAPTVTVEQSTTFTVIIKQNDCFTDTLTQSVTVHTMPKISLGADINASLREQVELSADTSNATGITWIPPINLSCDNCYNPIAYAERDIRYIARVTNEGCTAEDDIIIRVDCTEDNVWLPTSFTPNGDGKNEYFYPRGVPQQAIEYMAIYNRWGQRIFEREHFAANNPTDGWSGGLKGRLADVGVYTYIIRFACGGGKKLVLKGDVTLLR
jgi:gliding motility-associated-like protein